MEGWGRGTGVGDGENGGGVGSSMSSGQLWVPGVTDTETAEVLHLAVHPPCVSLTGCWPEQHTQAGTFISTARSQTPVPRAAESTVSRSLLMEHGD